MCLVVLFKFKTKERKLRQTTSQQEESVSENKMTTEERKLISISHIIRNNCCSDNMAAGMIRYKQKMNKTCFSPRSSSCSSDFLSDECLQRSDFRPKSLQAFIS